MAETSAVIFAKARVLPDEVWQIGIERLPFWIHPPEASGPSARLSIRRFVRALAR